MLLERIVTRSVNEELASYPSLTRRVVKQGYIVLAVLGESWRTETRDAGNVVWTIVPFNDGESFARTGHRSAILWLWKTARAQQRFRGERDDESIEKSNEHR